MKNKQRTQGKTVVPLRSLAEFMSANNRDADKYFFFSCSFPYEMLCASYDVSFMASIGSDQNSLHLAVKEFTTFQ